MLFYDSDGPELKKAFSLKRSVCADLLLNDETPASVIHAIVLSAYGVRAIYDTAEDEAYDPALVYAALERDFQLSSPIPLEAENRFRALKNAVETEDFYDDPFIFTATAEALNNGDVADLLDGSTTDLTGAEAFWAMYEVGVNRDESEEFHTDVANLIHSELSNDPETGFGEALDYVLAQHQRLKEDMLKAGFIPEAVESAFPFPMDFLADELARIVTRSD